VSVWSLRESVAGTIEPTLHSSREASISQYYNQFGVIYIAIRIYRDADIYKAIITARKVMSI
jgi:hypothetical protein